MSEALIPNDRPYGARKELREQMQAGNIPTGVRAGGEPTAVSSGAASTPPQRAAGPTDLSGYDVFANRQPSEPQLPQEAAPPITTGGVLAQTAQTASNPFVRELATRLTQLRRG